MLPSKDLQTHVHDVIIVGAGPSGLAVAARLLEPLPGAQFTSDEHQRYHWIRKHGHRASIKNWKTGSVSPPSSKPGGFRKPDILVLDEDGDKWMARWNRLFSTFGITYLRSPMFFHLDPAERDGLLSYAYFNGRENEMREIKGCVGKELSKHQRKKRDSRKKPTHPAEDVINERDRTDYNTPSTPLFRAHCDCVLDRYKLDENLLAQESVKDIAYGHSALHPQADKLFTVSTNKGQHFAKIVVLAVGPGNKAYIPGLRPADRLEGACHTMHIDTLPSKNVKARIASRIPTNVLIVGGGLTSAQIADSAIRAGVSKVWLIMRGPLKVKHFDMDLEWVGKFRNQRQAAFWSADSDEERFEMYHTARNGGSINPFYKKVIEKHVSTGRLSVLTFTTIDSKDWNSTAKQWSVKLTSNYDTAPDLPPIDYIYFATGIETDHRTLPFLESVNRDYPIPSAGGFPCITDDMMWRKDLPLFVNGRLAAMQLGPGAPNLIGARVGAERIAWSVQALLDDEVGGEEHDQGPEVLEFNYRTSRGNRFDSLISVS